MSAVPPMPRCRNKVFGATLRISIIVCCMSALKSLFLVDCRFTSSESSNSSPYFVSSSSSWARCRRTPRFQCLGSFVRLNNAGSQAELLRFPVESLVQLRRDVARDQGVDRVQPQVRIYPVGVREVEPCRSNHANPLNK